MGKGVSWAPLLPGFGFAGGLITGYYTVTSREATGQERGGPQGAEGFISASNTGQTKLNLLFLGVS